MTRAIRPVFDVLTAEGRGAIAVVRLLGAGAFMVADRVFRPHRGRPLGETPPGRLRLGRAGVGVGDEVVAVRFEGPTPVVEIQCHGGTAAVAAVTRALEEAGAIRGDPRSAGPGLDPDSIRAQAMEDLAAAPTLRTAEILLDQVHGALGRAFEGIAAAPRLDEIDALLRRAEVGTRLLRGWKVLLAGRPNVGKSRLFNALAGFERSIVHQRPGVTRDVVSIRTAFGGWPVELSDTAGDRESVDIVERMGIDRARRERADADLVLLVLDRSEPLQDGDRGLLAATSRPLVVANKSDLPAAWEPRQLESEGWEVFAVSAETGLGVDGLIRGIASRLVPVAPEPGAAAPFRREHVLALESARALLFRSDGEGE